MSIYPPKSQEISLRLFATSAQPLVRSLALLAALAAIVIS